MTLRQKAKYAAVGASMMVGNAMAAVPAEVSDSLDELKADATTIAGLAFIVFLAILAFKYFKRATS